jgi:hypothetical protein
VGPRAGLDSMEKRKIVRSRESNPDRLAHGPSLYRLLAVPGNESNLRSMIASLRVLTVTVIVFVVIFGDRNKVPAARTYMHAIEAADGCHRVISRSRCCLFCTSFVHVPPWPSCPHITCSSSHHEEVLGRMFLFLIREI